MERNICKISNVRSGDLICAEFVYETELKNVERVMTDKHLIGFVCSGEGRFSIENKEYPLKRGGVFFAARNSEYRLSLNEDCTYFYISFFGRRGDELAERCGLGDSQCVADVSWADSGIIEFAKSATASSESSMIENAILTALFLPTPGNFLNCCISFSRGARYSAMIIKTNRER